MVIYLFVYGSLINTHQKYKHIPVVVKDLQRHWILCINNKRYFGIYDEPGYLCNGLLIKINTDELLKLDKREEYYIRKEINKDRFNIRGDLLDDVVIYTYYPNISMSIKSYFDNKSKQCLKYLYIWGPVGDY